MSAIDHIESELFKEKGLLSVYLKSNSYGENGFDRTVKSGTGILLTVCSIYLPFSRSDLFTVAGRAVVDWVSLGFTYSITILGFLVAGFTIFATMTKVEMFITLSQIRHKTKDVSQLKFIFYSFLRVFISHIMLLFIAVSISMARDCSPIYLTAMSLSAAKVILSKKIAVLILLPTVGSILISSVLQLKTFVWNLYQSIIVTVAMAAQLYENDRQK